MQYISESINLPVSEVTAFKVLSDLNVILRLSPYWSLKALKSISKEPIKKGSKYEATIEYYGKDITETHGLEVAELSKDRRISFKVKEGILKEISFDIEKNSNGVQMTHRFLIDSDDEAILKGTRSEFVFWMRSIGEYLKLAEGKTLWRRFFKWFMDKVWLKLTLSERKIAIIVTKISILELVLLLILIIIWNLLKR